MRLREYRISKFPGGACPRTPLERKAFKIIPACYAELPTCAKIYWNPWITCNFICKALYNLMTLTSWQAVDTKGAFLLVLKYSPIFSAEVVAFCNFSSLIFLLWKFDPNSNLFDSKFLCMIESIKISSNWSSLCHWPCTSDVCLINHLFNKILAVLSLKYRYWNVQ